MFEVIHAYALAHGGDEYVDSFVDRSRTGSPIVVAFTDRIDQHREALLASRAAADDPPMTAQAARPDGTASDTRPTNTTTLGEAGWPIEVVQRNDAVSRFSGLRNRVNLYGQGVGRSLHLSTSNNSNEEGRLEISVDRIDDDIRRELASRFGADRICVRVTKIGTAVK